MPIITAQERVGTVIDQKIRLDRILGEGGMGVVYAATHLRLERPVAVKFLHGQFSQHPDIVARFLTEARATSRLSHPNVIDVRDVAVAEDGAVYMVLELLQGESLGDYLQKRGRLGLEETLAILGPVMDALAAAHDAKITHRDIKPDNIFLSRTPDGRLVPKVLDFGIAKLADGSSSSATATGSVMGTPMYMSPEQAMGRTKEIGAPSDVWSTAVMTYECLTGTFPFDVELNAPPTAMIFALMTGTIVPVSQRRPDLPPAVADALMRALDRSVVTRTPSMRALLEELTRASRTTGPMLPFDPMGATMLPASELLRADTDPSVRTTPHGIPSEALATSPTVAAATVPDVSVSGLSLPGGAALGPTGGAPSGRRPWLLAAGICAALVVAAGIAAAANFHSAQASVLPPILAAPARPVESPAAGVLPRVVQPSTRLLPPVQAAQDDLTETAPAVRLHGAVTGAREPRARVDLGAPPRALPPLAAPSHPAIAPTSDSLHASPPPPSAAQTALPAPPASHVGVPALPVPPTPVVTPPPGTEHRAGGVTVEDF